MSDSMDTTTPSDPVGSASATAPKKPSLRILEGGPAGLSTREDDLAHGPSLLGLGDGHDYVHGPFDSRLAPDLELEALIHHDPETSVLPSFPLELPAPGLPQTMSLSEVSRSGASLSLPADTVSSTGLSHAEEQMRVSATNTRVAPLFAWKYEFSWEGSCQCFDGKPLELAKPHENRFSEANPGSEIALSTSLVPLPRSQSRSPAADEFEPLDIAGIRSFGNWAGHWAVDQLSQDLETASAVFSISSDGSRSDTVGWDELTTRPSNPNLSVEMDRRVDWLVDLLIDDYHRSYAPQRSQRCSSAAQNKIADQTIGNTSAKTRRTSKSTIGRKGPPRRKAVDDAEDSEDEDDRGDGEGSSSARGSSGSRPFACPFYKWNPKKYGSTCARRHFKRIGDLKYHIRQIHEEPLCHKCHTRFPVEFHKCGPVRADFPVDVITQEKREAIRERAKRSQSHEEQWQHIYGVLFPNKPRCFSPYLDDMEEEHIRSGEQYLRSPHAQMVLHEAMKEMGCDAEEKARALELIYRHFFPRLWPICAPNGEVHSHMSHYENEAPSLTQTNQTVDPRDINTLAPHDTGSYTLEHDATLATQAYPFSTIAEPPESISGLFTNESKIEDLVGEASLNATSIEDAPNATDIEGLGFHEDDTFGTPQDGSFTYLAWLEGRETFDTSMDLTLEGLM